MPLHVESMVPKLRGLSTVRIGGEALLARLKHNRQEHLQAFERAMVAYQEAIILELNAQLERARAGQPPRQFSRLVRPTDHTRDYDQVIELIELSLDREFELTAQDFARYVRDDWEWKAGFTESTNAVYEYLTAHETPAFS